MKTDHKPLVRLFGHENEIPKIATSRLTRWALILSSYMFKVDFSKGSNNKAADALSRLPLPNTGEPGDQPDYSTRILQSQMEDLNLTRKQLKQETTKDRLLQKVIEFVERMAPEAAAR